MIKFSNYLSLSILVTVLVTVSACASQVQTIPGTEIPNTTNNRDIIQAIEKYRLAVESKDVAALVLMTSQSYWEDGGTPTGGDDYGYEGLKEVLKNRFDKVSDIRYSLKYIDVQRRCRESGDSTTNEGCRAYVDVLIDASFSVVDAQGRLMRSDKRDQNQLVLEWSGDKWLFLSGM
jgi:hypothetical protein